MIGIFVNDIELASHKSFGTVLEISKQLVSNMCHINNKKVEISSIEILYEAYRSGGLTFMSTTQFQHPKSVINLFSKLEIMKLIGYYDTPCSLQIHVYIICTKNHHTETEVFHSLF